MGREKSHKAELQQLERENEELRKELELEKLRAENDRMRREINELKYGKYWYYIDPLCPHQPWTSITLC